jgi:hypothetical protein
MISATLKSMKPALLSLAIALMTVAGASCAQPQKPVAATKASAVGARFDEIGKVTMHAGQPCTSQIMFDFQTTRSSRRVWMAARMHETKMLTEAAKRRRPVHVWGSWQRGREKGCSYVHVTKVEVTSSRFF